VPPDPKNDKALQVALDLLRGIKTAQPANKAATPANPAAPANPTAPAPQVEMNHN